MNNEKLSNELDTIHLIIRRIQGSLKAYDDETFAKNQEAIDAMAYRLAMVGEHCKRLPDDLKERHPNLPWRKMVGMRNIVSHAYEKIDTGIVWSAATVDLPQIEKMVREELLRLDLDRAREGRSQRDRDGGRGR